jgi:hypothetical protein
MIACTKPNACATLRSSRSAWNVRTASKPSLRSFRSVRAQAESLSRDFCDLPLYQAPPDMDKRRTMNALLMAAVALPIADMGYMYLSSLAPPRYGNTASIPSAAELERQCSPSFKLGMPGQIGRGGGTHPKRGEGSPFGHPFPANQIWDLSLVGCPPPTTEPPLAFDPGIPRLKKDVPQARAPATYKADCLFTERGVPEVPWWPRMNSATTCAPRTGWPSTLLETARWCRDWG